MRMGAMGQFVSAEEFDKVMDEVSAEWDNALMQQCGCFTVGNHYKGTTNFTYMVLH